VELLVEPEQVLLDRRLGHHQIDGDLAGRRGQHERLVGQRWFAQGGQHIQLAPRQFWHGRTPRHVVRRKHFHL
jgi:hypothetical protein